MVSVVKWELNLSDIWFGFHAAVPGTCPGILINEKCPDYVHKAWASQQVPLGRSSRRSCQEGASGGPDTDEMEEQRTQKVQGVKQDGKGSAHGGYVCTRLCI